MIRKLMVVVFLTDSPAETFWFATMDEVYTFGKKQEDRGNVYKVSLYETKYIGEIL
jgi:hypothetical protein